eukprot:gb/GEZN01007513.1/.p1 GENE.gb/GEZN01007513.1/~~gb/GEZN01007513.1/.p1  ORF type:complete len:473 (+),score=42.41 gb/GEZN01007513.1/:78-1496(+)
MSSLVRRQDSGLNEPLVSGVTTVASSAAPPSSSHTIQDSRHRGAGTVAGLKRFPAAALLVADNVGTGVLALPGYVDTLGLYVGISFIVLQIPINLFAAESLVRAAELAEGRRDENGSEKRAPQDLVATPHRDVIHLAQTLEQDGGCLLRSCTQACFYSNMVLVLGNYMLVMSRSVQAMFSQHHLCQPTAGLLVSLVLLCLNLLPSMKHLGRWPTLLSIATIIACIVICLVHKDPELSAAATTTHGHDSVFTSSMHQVAALTGIIFASGSQKLLLNIRAEMVAPAESVTALKFASIFYTLGYVLVVWCTGDHPPELLLDVLPQGTWKRLAGLCLFLHVSVSYAINSQALSANVLTLLGSKVERLNPALRWFLTTTFFMVMSWLLSNLIPFFGDLVSIIGAMTTVPLAMLLPAMFFRRAFSTRLCQLDWWNAGNLYLVLFSLLALVLGTLGACTDIVQDWQNSGAPFDCNVVVN